MDSVSSTIQVTEVKGVDTEKDDDQNQTNEEEEKQKFDDELDHQTTLKLLDYKPRANEGSLDDYILKKVNRQYNKETHS